MTVGHFCLVQPHGEGAALHKSRRPGGSFKKVNFWTSTTPALRATFPQLRRGLSSPWQQSCYDVRSQEDK
jgi:hypothetical protein